MNPEGPAHTEEGGGRTGGACMSPCTNVCGSSGREEKHSLLNAAGHLCSATALLTLQARRGNGVQQLISPKGYVQVQESGWKTSAAHTRELPAALRTEQDKDSWQAALWTLLPSPHFLGLTSDERRTAVVAILLLLSYELFKRLLLSCLSLPKGIMASAHFGCWVPHHACQGFSVCTPELSSRL